MIKKLFNIAITMTLIAFPLNGLSNVLADMQIDTTAPEIISEKNIFLQIGLSQDEARAQILQQVKAIDDVDGEISRKIKFTLPPNLNKIGNQSLSMNVTDQAGNRTSKGVTLHLVQSAKYFTGIDPLTLTVDEEVDLLQGVKAFDDTGKELAVSIESLNYLSYDGPSTLYDAYQLIQIDNNIYKVISTVEQESEGFIVTYKSVDSKGVSRTATRYIDTRIGVKDEYIKNIQVSQQFVKPGDSVSITADVVITDEKIKMIGLIFKYSKEYSNVVAVLYYNPLSGKYEGSVKIPEMYDNKKWELDSAIIQYENGKNFNQKLNNYLKNTHFNVYNGIDLEKPQLKFERTLIETSLQVPVDLLQHVTAYDLVDGNLTSKITVESDADFNKVGSYDVTYFVTDEAGNTASETIILKVKDLGIPSILVQNPKVVGYVEQGEEELKKLILNNVSAVDDYDGVISDKVTIDVKGGLKIAGPKTIIYTVEDLAGNQATAEAQLDLQSLPNYINQNVPEYTIALVGQPIDYIEDAKAFDPLGMELKPKIHGKVNFDVVGKYKLTYEYTNRIGKTFEVLRTIEVKEKSMPYFVGLEPITTTVGKPVDYFMAVKAYDMFGKSIDTRGYGDAIDFNKAGVYTYYYNAFDSLGQQINGEQTITVIDNTPFKDVPKNHLYFKEIQTLKEAQIVNGYPGNLYGPTDAILRGQVAALIARSGIDLTPIRPAKQFKDVPSSHMFYNEIETLYRAGIIDGTGDNFNPNDTLTREQLAKILVLAFSLKNQGGYEYYFNDMNQSDWAYEYVLNLASNGITIGAYGNYMPKGTVTREQYAIFMYRALGY